MLNRKEHGVLWIELFFDIIIVAGISEVIVSVVSITKSGSFEFNHTLVETLIEIFILFDTWIKVLLVENKMNILERLKKETIKSKILEYYQIIIYTIFIISILLLSKYSNGFLKDPQTTIFYYLIIQILLNLLLKEHKYSLGLLIVIQILTFWIKPVIILDIFLGYLVIDAIKTYIDFENISLRKQLVKDEEIDQKVTDMFLLPHILERMGILMIVFLAEFFLVLLIGVQKIEFIMIIIFYLYILVFYNNYFNLLDSLKKVDIKESKILKKIIYSLICFFIGIISFTIFLKLYEIHKENNIYLIISFIFTIMGDLLIIRYDLLEFYEVRNKQRYSLIYLLLIFVISFGIFIATPLGGLILMIVGMLIKMLINKRYTNLKYVIK